jgi:WD40 repeat protein
MGDNDDRARLSRADLDWDADLYEGIPSFPPGVQYVDPRGIEIPRSVIELLPESLARRHIVIPLAVEGDTLTILASDPSDIETIDKLRFVLGRDIVVALAPRDAIVEAINKHYGAEGDRESIEEMVKDFEATAIDFDDPGDAGGGEEDAAWVEKADDEILAAIGADRGVVAEKAASPGPTPEASPHTATPSNEGGDPAGEIRYPSLSALRAAHLELLKTFQRPANRPPTVVEGGTGPSDEERLHAAEAFIRQGRATGAVIRDGKDRWEAQSLLDYWVTVLYRAGLKEPPDATLAAFDESAAPELPDDRCPFVGLDAFDEHHRDYFFGRQRAIDEMLERLRAGRLLAVVGPSGSGKSSLVLAGLVPALRAGGVEGSRDWLYPPPLVPGSDPLGALARSLCPGRVAEARAELLRDPAAPARLASEAAGPGRPTMLVIDQGEEAFTLCLDEAARAAFFAGLAALVAADGPRHTLVFTLRADYTTQVARYGEFNAIFRASEVLVPALTRAELLEAIEKPAELAGLQFEEGVAGCLVDDVLGDPAALPLLQFALRKLWDGRSRNVVTWAAYRAIGDARTALAKTADTLYDGLSEEDRRAVQRVLLALVRPGIGWEFTSSRVAVGALLALGASDRYRRILATLKATRLIRITPARVPADGSDPLDDPETLVEVAHEAFVRNWPRFVDWLEAERDRKRQRLRLTAAAELWKAHGEDKGGLLGGSLLAEARTYDDLNDLEARFVRASQDAKLAEEAETLRRQRELEQARERELEQARERAKQARERAKDAEVAAERQRRLSHRLLVSAVVAGLFAITSAGLAIWANSAATAAKKESQRARQAELEARTQTKLAESRRVAALSASEIDRHLDRSLILAVEAIKIEDTREARKSLLNGLLARPGILAFLQSEGDVVEDVVLSPDGKTLAMGYRRDELGTSGGVVLWDVARRGRLTNIPLAVAEGGVVGVAFSPDGKTLAAGYRWRASGGSGVVLWDMARRARLAEKPLAVAEGSIASVAFSPDGKLLAAGYGSVGGRGAGGVVLFDTASGARVVEQPLVVAQGDVTDVAFSADGTTLAAGYRALFYGGVGGGVMFWDVANRSRLAGEPRPVAAMVIAEGGVASVAFSPDGKLLAAGFQEPALAGGGGVVLWNSATHAQLAEKPLAVAEGSVRGVAFSPDGKTLAAGYGRGTGGGVVLWEMPGGVRQASVPLVVAEGLVGGVAFGPDGKTLAIGYAGGVVLWDTAGRVRLAEEPLAGRDGSATSVAFSPDGKVLAASFRYGVPAVVLWDVARRARLTDESLAYAELGVTSMAFSPNGRTLATGSDFNVFGVGGSVVFWDVARHVRLVEKPLAVAEGGVTSVAFSPDGNLLAAGYPAIAQSGGGVVLWDAERRVRLVEKPLAVAEGGVTSVAFSLDGNLLAAGYGASNDGAFVGGVVLWDVARRARLTERPLAVADGSVGSVAFSPDGNLLAAGAVSSVVLWDVASRARLADKPLVVPPGPFVTVSFSPDGKLLAAGCGSHVAGAVLWHLDLEFWQRQAREIANRNLTQDEWRQYFPGMAYRRTFEDLPVPPGDLPGLTPTSAKGVTTTLRTTTE